MGTLGLTVVSNLEQQCAGLSGRRQGIFFVEDARQALGALVNGV